ncbi:hypothetical protein NDU88_000415 [Pleurodeles waltl]|uniref:Uncharacterized protein n=1 Tax=Pleurodeles waltl TaxID=8319 RepID=A0AAV7TFP0_PLEWA|nr:hypothetical protein NDU88_000415 [Pleurodeles waltl]
MQAILVRENMLTSPGGSSAAALSKDPGHSCPAQPGANAAHPSRPHRETFSQGCNRSSMSSSQGALLAEEVGPSCHQVTHGFPVMPEAAVCSRWLRRSPPQLVAWPAIPHRPGWGLLRWLSILCGSAMIASHWVGGPVDKILEELQL